MAVSADDVVLQFTFGIEGSIVVREDWVVLEVGAEAGVVVWKVIVLARRDLITKSEWVFC